jgi:hypothetical protein
MKVSKAEFAKMLGVNSAKVTAWIGSGLLDGKAVVGPLIESETAIRQLRKRLEVSDVDDLDVSDVDVLLRVHGLLQATLRANLRELESKVRRGVLIEKKKAVEMLKAAAAKEIREYEEVLPRLARKVAAEFGIPERDVLKTFRDIFYRKTLAKIEGTIAEAVKRIESSKVGDDPC